MSDPFFTDAEYASRLQKVKHRMAEASVDLLLVADANNIFWLTGAADWSFYTPQFVIVSLQDSKPVWIGRAMDAPGAALTTWMGNDHVIGYPEDYVMRRDIHPSDYIGEFVAKRWPSARRIGYESDSYFFSPRSLNSLIAKLPNGVFVDCDLLVNRARVVKSETEIQYHREAAIIVQGAMHVAQDMIQPGVRQSDVIAEIYKAQIAPDAPFGGDITALCPIILAGEKASAAHPAWTDEKFIDNQTVAIELAGARRHYTTGLARTLHLGSNPPDELTHTAAAVEEGMSEVLAMVKTGVSGADIHASWQQVLNRYGLRKDSRIGYSIGIGLPPDWGEHVISLRPGEHEPIETNTTLHIILGMWMKGWGMETSETIVVQPQGYECLTQFPRSVNIKR